MWGTDLRRYKMNKLSSEERTKISKFAGNLFGRKSYQASKFFFDWVVNNNYLKILTIKDENLHVISMIHKISLNYDKNKINSFFNFVSDQNYRGAGLKHLVEIKKENCFFIPAVTDQLLSLTYEKFGANKLRFQWYKRYLIPFPSLIAFKYYFGKKNNIIMQMRGNIIITNDIHSGNKLNKIAKKIGLNDFRYLQWRLQSINNKRVFLIEDNVRNGFVIAILGRRKKIPLLRIISSNGSSAVVKNLIDEACRFSRKLGALLCLVTIHHSQSDELSKDNRYKPRKGINTFLKGQVNLSENMIMLYGDLGIEEQFGI